MTTLNPTARPHHVLNVVLWIVRLLLAAAFLAAGMMKLTQPAAQLATMLVWTAEVPLLLVRFIGLAEVAGALGLVLPAVTRIQLQLTRWAPLGLTAVMPLAALFHVLRGEVTAAPSVVLGLLAAFVAWGCGRVPILSR